MAKNVQKSKEKNIAEKNIALDSLRCIAMLMVLAVHFGIYWDMGKLNTYLNVGMRGVQIFFVLSGYLNMGSYENSYSKRDYYGKKINRIIPIYFGFLIIALLFNEFILRNSPPDVFGLKWGRYFLFFNAIVPSNNEMWTNLYAFWTMGSFVVFYLITPLIARYVRSLKSSIIFLGLTGVLLAENKIIYLFLFGNSENVLDLSIFIGRTPMHNMYAFAIGVLLYRAKSEEEKNISNLILCMVMALGLVTGKDHFAWCALTGFYINACQAIRLPEKVCAPIKLLSKYSFAIYLAHSMSFDMADYIVSLLRLNRGLWLPIGGALLIFLSWVGVNIFGRVRLVK